jgi:hypothetical protein
MIGAVILACLVACPISVVAGFGFCRWLDRNHPKGGPDAG